MAAVKIGDSVRFLNEVGGGRVVRIEGGLAYVSDADGFETPVTLRECVVVGSFPEPDVPAPRAAAPVAPAATPAPAPRPEILLKGNDSIDVVLGFVPVDIKALSRSSFEAYLVNDSDYWLYVTVATRDTDEELWTPRFDGLIEPGMQDFLFELDNAALAAFGRLSVQYVAFRRSSPYALPRPGGAEFRVDATRFARLHCFRTGRYFDTPAITFDLGDAPQAAAPAPAPAKTPGPAPSAPAARRHGPRTSAPKESNDPLVVDLHASELLDSTAGLGPADILNLQVERFCRVMDENLRHPGRRIVFIHGKGEGVLRQALMKELTHRYKGHDVQDASFREYGFGATQVTIRQTAAVARPAAAPRRRR